MYEAVKVALDLPLPRSGGFSLTPVQPDSHTTQPWIMSRKALKRARNLNGLFTH